MVRLAGCIVCDQNGGVLMLHRNTPRRTQWEIPGGGVDPDEDAQTAAVRELQEELGVVVRVVRQLGERYFVEDGTTFEYAWFLAELLDGEPQLKEPELYDKFGYFSPVMLGRRWDELSPNTKNFMEELASGNIDLLI